MTTWSYGRLLKNLWRVLSPDTGVFGLIFLFSGGACSWLVRFAAAALSADGVAGAEAGTPPAGAT